MLHKFLLGFALAGLALSANANTDKPFHHTQEELSQHLSMNSNSMACEALGQASMIIAMFAHEMGLSAPENAQTLIDALKGYMSKNPPKATDMGELAYVSAIPYVLDTPDIVSVILKASGSAKDGDEARLQAHRAIASPCFATSYFPTASGKKIAAWDAKEGILTSYASRSE
jgi:hypothetical protein